MTWSASCRASEARRPAWAIWSKTCSCLARLDEGRPLEREEVELVGVSAEAVQTASTVGPGWPVRLVARQPVEIVGDRMRIRQVLDNLLANVRTHCPDGTSAVVTVDKDDHDAVISVADTGPGMRPEDAGRVFERFFRADASRSRRFGGAGLGLSIVASITKAHGGTVTAGPGPDGGTVFTVRLPRSGTPRPELVPRRMAALSPTITGTGYSQPTPSELCEGPEVRMVAWLP